MVFEYEPQKTENDGVTGFVTQIYSWCQVLILLSVSLCCLVFELSVESGMREVLRFYEFQVSVKWDLELFSPRRARVF